MTFETAPEITDEQMAAAEQELADLRHRQLMESAELELLRPLALREQIRQIGFDPDSPAGMTLVELAKTNEPLRTSARMMRAKAEQLGLSSDPSLQAPTLAPTAVNSDLIDPNLPAWHPRNDRADVAGQLAIRDHYANAAAQERYQAAEERGPLDHNGYPADEVDARQARIDAFAEARIDDLTEGRGLEPTYLNGRTAEQRALLSDNSRSIDARIAAAREAGDYSVAAQLERVKARGSA